MVNLKRYLYDYIRKSVFKLLFRINFLGMDYLYEPILLDGKLYESKREWKDRWNAISKELMNYRITNILDIGCAEGWFIRKAAEEHNCYCLGIEASDKRLTQGELARIYDAVENVSVMKAYLTPQNINMLPKFEAVICLSVLHHVIIKYGVEHGKKFVKSIVGRSVKIVVFEMGTSMEKENKWSTVLPEMPNGQEEFIYKLLKECGLKNLRTIASSPGIKKDNDRHVILGEV